MQDHGLRQDMRKHQLAIKVKNEEIQKEMKDCTFSPKIASKSKDA
jgi:hypothetical protein